MTIHAPDNPTVQAGGNSPIRRRRIWTRSAALCVGALLVLASHNAWIAPAIRIRNFLESDDSQQRKKGAWLAADSENHAMEDLIASRLRDNIEHDPDVRETFVYSLGRNADSRHFETILHELENDPEGYVRQAAWLAAARIDPVRTGTLVDNPGLCRDDWDRLGIAQVRLQLNQASGFTDLFRFAVDSDRSMQSVAARALVKSLQPVLDAVGRWPVTMPATPADEWSPEVFGELKRRCDSVDLQFALADTMLHAERSMQVRRNEKKITVARDRIAKVLFPAADAMPRDR